jgi:hypothetical protein
MQKPIYNSNKEFLYQSFGVSEARLSEWGNFILEIKTPTNFIPLDKIVKATIDFSSTPEELSYFMICLGQLNNDLMKKRL